MKKALRSGLLFAAFVMLFSLGERLLAVPFALLAIFYFAIDFLMIDRTRAPESLDSAQPYAEGVLGDYVVDSDNSYGLFLRISSQQVFVDIRRDKLIRERERHALFLYKNAPTLEHSLSSFLRKNPEYRSRRLIYIGVHSSNVEQCDVFWEPDGHSSLVGLSFEL